MNTIDLRLEGGIVDSQQEEHQEKPNPYAFEGRRGLLGCRPASDLYCLQRDTPIQTIFLEN